MNFDILRQKILEKAIRGELVPQLESEPAVEQIAKAPEDMPFAIPKKWKWVKFSQVLTLENGDRGENYPAKSKLTRTNTGHPFVSAANLENSKISEKDLLFMTQEQCFRLRSGHIKKGDCLFCIRGSLGKFGFAISDGGAIASSLVILRPKNEIFQDYLMVWIKSDQFKKLISTYSNGSAQPNLGAKVLSSFPIPLPPIPEQHRITTKINQLFKQIDCAEQAYNELSGSLAERFRELCLEKAIQGKLVPQLESEPEVEQIGEAPEDVPFAIPEKWKWVLFSDAVKVISSRPFQIKAKEVLEQGLYPVISQSKEQIDGYSNDDKKLIPDSELPIIIFGDHTRTLKYVDFRFVVGADGTKLLHVKTSSIDPKYFYIALQSMIGQTRQRGYSRHFQFLKVLHIPIPPIEEQRRIVAKLNELLDSTSQLERTISTP